MSAPRLYTELASWWPLMSPPGEYAEEAAFYLAALEAACEHPLGEVLELGSGGGNNASHLKAHVRMVLVDLSPAMLAVSRALNPACEHVEGDMRAVRLGREFDAVFVHDAVSYLTTEADLRLAIETAYVHCRPGGAALFAPDHLRENFRPATDHGGVDDGPRGLRTSNGRGTRTRQTPGVSWNTRTCCGGPTGPSPLSTIAMWKGSSRAPTGCACSRKLDSNRRCCRSNIQSCRPIPTKCSSPASRDEPRQHGRRAARER